MTGLLQKLKGQLCDVLPCSLDVTRLCTACADGEAQDKAAGKLTRHHVDLFALGDPFQQVLVQLIGALRGRGKEEMMNRLFVLPSRHYWVKLLVMLHFKMFANCFRSSVFT